MPLLLSRLRLRHDSFDNKIFLRQLEVSEGFAGLSLSLSVSCFIFRPSFFVALSLTRTVVGA